MIKQAFENKKSLFIPFLMAGHPTRETSIEAMIALSESGADLIELGVPFSDPIADGVINQRASEIALEQHTTLQSTFELVREVRLRGCATPIILFSYLNPILSLSIEKFGAEAKHSGVNGVLIVDLPPEEGQAYYAQLRQAGLEIVLLASPTTDPGRFALYQQLQPVFLYYISRLSVTGLQNTLAPNLEAEINQLRSQLPDLPIVIGFGISTCEQAAKVAKFTDGVVIGSILVHTLQEKGLRAFRELANELATEIHADINKDTHC